MTDKYYANAEEPTVARIIKIGTDGQDLTSVDLEWNGPWDHVTTDFDLSVLGKVFREGGTLSSGWVILTGPCKLKVGDTVPLLPEVAE